MTNAYLVSWLPSSTSPKWAEHRDDLSFEINASYDTLFDPGNTEILHLVTTRFMQNQPNFLSLGKARLRLFQTFCLPSMNKQEVSSFLWFVLTDPELHPTLVEPLKNLLAPHPNFFLIQSNEQLISPEDFAAVASEGHVVSGDIEVLLSSLYDQNRSLLLETRLDADDALDRRALSDIQDMALNMPPITEGWKVICNGLHYEWRNPEITSLNHSVQTPGRLRVVKESICVTPGYTLVKHRANHSVALPNPPRTQHHLITRDWPKCGNKRTNATTNCWIKMKMYPSALRCRTITSAGMSRIETTPEAPAIYDNQTETFWKFVARDYGILPQAGLEASQFLQANLQGIVYDNLLGQCTTGHSCKKSSKDKLGALFNETLKFQKQA